MIQKGTRLVVADNSGAKVVECFHIFGGTNKRTATLGQIIKCSVKSAIPGREVKKKQIVAAVVVRTRKEFRRPDGSYISFGENAAVIIKGVDEHEPVGTRISGPVPRELKAQFPQIVSLAFETL